MPITGTLLLIAVAAAFTANRPGEPQASATRNAGTASQGAAKQSSAASRAASKPATTSKRKIPCKTPENASLCYWTHGRLSRYDVTLDWLIWKIGTHRLVKIYNGPSHFPPRIDADIYDPEFPANLKRVYDADYLRWKRSQEDLPYFAPNTFADFEICPLEPEKKGWMQAVCIESAKNIFVQDPY